jgi:cytochrome oxidase Cu insertion factor (SCO1/SenC/PrrC family)
MVRLARQESLDLDALREEVSEWYALKRQVNIVSNELDKRTKRLKETLQKYGEVDPAKGDVYINLGDPIGDQNISWMKNLCVTSKNMNEEVAEEILGDKGMWEDMTELIRVPDESRILAAYYDKKITDDELARMFPQIVSYRFYLLDDDQKPVRA